MLMINLCTSQLYTRISFGEVEEELLEFVYTNHLRNCFKYKNDVNRISLKCLNDNILYDIEFSMRKSYEKPYEYLAINV